MKNYLANAIKIPAVIGVAMMLAVPVVGHAESALTISGDLSTHIGATTDYRFRGVSQTFGDPALQAGAELNLKNQFYVGTWASTIDKQILRDTRGIEWDIYGGYRWSMANGLEFDAGLIQYLYLGESSLNTLEGFIGASFDFVSFKYSHTLSNRFFGVLDARGSQYYDLTLRYPLGPDLVGVAHYGVQRVHENDGDYTDYALGVEKEWNAFTWSAHIVGTDSDFNVTDIAGRTRGLGGRGFVFSVGKTF